MSPTLRITPCLQICLAPDEAVEILELSIDGVLYNLVTSPTEPKFFFIYLPKMWSNIVICGVWFLNSERQLKYG